MATVDSGLKDLTWAAKDTGVAVANDSIADLVGDSSYVDLRDATSNLIADQLFLNFDITVSAGTYNMLIYVFFSEDGSAAAGDNPLTGDSELKKILVASLTAIGAASLLSRSNIYAVPVLARYFRLIYENDGSGQSVTINSRYAASWQQSYSA
jgi:hypothetical protein